MLSIRPAQLPDHELIQALWEEARLPTVPLEEWDTLIASPSAVVLLAEEEGALDGAAVGSFDGWRAYIYHVTVVPARRERGVAHQLLAAAERELQRMGARRVYIMVGAENAAGLALSATAGYEPDGDLVLVKDLASEASAASPGDAAVS